MQYPCECGCGVKIEKTLAVSDACRKRIVRNQDKVNQNVRKPDKFETESLHNVRKEDKNVTNNLPITEDDGMPHLHEQSPLP
jgi:hypothetical protein